MQSTSLVRCAQSSAPDPVEAAREFHAAVRQDDMELVLFFCSSDYDLDLLAAEMNHLFPGVRVIGCTTAGEIGPAGYLTHGLSGVSFPKSGFAIEVGFIDNVQSFEFEQGRSLTFSVMQRLEARPSLGPHPSQFAFLLIDGLSMREEWVAKVQVQAEAAGSAFFFKQWGGWGADGVKRHKKANGRIFQGRTWDDYPQLAAQA